VGVNGSNDRSLSGSDTRQLLSIGHSIATTLAGAPNTPLLCNGTPTTRSRDDRASAHRSSAASAAGEHDRGRFIGTCGANASTTY
jgi:hypothetical protein